MSAKSSTGSKTSGFSCTSIVKKKFPFPEKFMPKTAIGEEKFRGLVETSTIFIDKSLLIKEFIEDSSCVILITCPRRWGKSVNLDMIKTFFEIEVDEYGRKHQDKTQANNYKLFKGEITYELDEKKKDELEQPFKIAQDSSFLEKNQGEYPVIMVNFKDVKGNTFMEILRAIKKSISDAFKQHEYLLNVYDLTLKNTEIGYAERLTTTRYLNIFKRIYNNYGEEAKQHDVEESLYFLSKILHGHFNKRVIILIDEYDAVLNSLFQNTVFSDLEIERTLNIFGIMLGSALKGNEHLKKGLVTGVFRMAKSRYLSSLNNWVEYNFLNNNFAKYYGFIEDELKPLFEEYKISQSDQLKVYYWYDGYRVTTDSTLKIFNPWSIVNFLHSKKLEIYREETVTKDLIRNFFKSELMKEKIECLLSQDNVDDEDQDSVLVDLNGLKFSIENLKILQKFFSKEDSCEIGYSTIPLLFRYIFAAGYLTITNEQNYSQLSSLKLPNQEVRSELEKELINHYMNIYNIDVKLFKSVTNELAKLFDKNDPIDLKNSLEMLFMAFPTFSSLETSNQEKGIHEKGDVIHSIINFTVLQIKNLSDFGTKFWYKKQGVDDVLLINEITQCGMIIEINYEGSADEALNQAQKYLSLFREFKNIQNIMIVGISVSNGNKVDITSNLEIK
ncbi:unnamed protein product [Brachionus calyciflorus]|uniref:AAA-ATPase-like domain-containing protein n=1 Tax=Brachionus calyciflorus TaxID=104777 RepID=A0A813RZI8_9BILA|nr:unnamed protein product [Brachionus calyciflorus]